MSSREVSAQGCVYSKHAREMATAAIGTNPTLMCTCLCHLAGEATVNLTTLYDIVTKLSKELEETKEKLKIGKSI